MFVNLSMEYRFLDKITSDFSMEIIKCVEVLKIGVSLMISSSKSNFRTPSHLMKFGIVTEPFY